MPRKSVNHYNPLNNGPRNKLRVDQILTLDELNLKLLKDLVNDSGIKSAELSKKYQVPLSTIQRRRTKLERSILKKKYEVDFSLLRTRQADLMISVGQGDSEQTAKKVLESFQDNIISISMRIGDPEINLMSRVIYQSTEELHQLIEGIKSVPSVKSVDWSELVKVVTDRAGAMDGSGRMLDKIFKSGIS